MATKLKSIDKIFILCLCSVIFFSVSSAVSGDKGLRAETGDKTAPFWVSRISEYGRDYWAKLVGMFGRGHSYFFPPNVDFRGKEEEGTGGVGSSSSSTGEKVREAAANSFEKSKETMEEAAVSAAETVKKTLSGEDEL